MTMDAEILSQRVITGVAPGPRLLIIAGVHGDEYEPMAAVRQLMTRIDAAQLRGAVTLAPVVNRPAFERRTRTAQDGLDLARTCPGRADGSITERIAHAVSELIRRHDVLIDLHTGGQAYELLPLVGYLLHSDPAILAQQRTLAQAFNLPIVWGTPAHYEGRTLSVARDAGIPALYAEHGGPGPLRSAAIADYVQGCLNVMAALDMLDQPAPTPRRRIVVEQTGATAGHLQVQHPAPCAGFFTAQVQLGARVTPGQLLGTITDELGDHVEPLYAQQPGLVLCLRVGCRVEQGDGLVTVLPTDEQWNSGD